MRRKQRKENTVPGLMISPMIDLIFQLLVFFIVSTMYMSDIRTIPVRLPTAQNAEITNKSSFAVTIKKDGKFYLDDKQIAFKTLVADAASESKRNSNFSVVIRSDKQVDYGRVIKLLDALKGAGVKRFGLAADANGQDSADANVGDAK